MSPTLLFLFATASATYGLPQGLNTAICTVESNLNPKAVNEDDGGSASLGICQIKLYTARTLGFKGTATELQRPETNIRYASAYLRSQLNRYSGDIRKAVSAYNMGTYREREDGTTYNRRYVSKVFHVWANEL